MKQNQYFRIFFYLSFAVLLWVYGGFAAPKTPSHVFQQTEDIKADIELIRTAMDATDYPLEPEYQLLKKPIHVYGKGLEVLEKLSKVQAKLDLPTATVGQIPLRQIQPDQVFQLTQQIRKELRKIKAKLNIDKNIQPAPFVNGKKPSHVYRNLWAASYMLDALVGSITPSDVFRKAHAINSELDMIAGHMKLSVNLMGCVIYARRLGGLDYPQRCLPQSSCDQQRIGHDCRPYEIVRQPYRHAQS